MARPDADTEGTVSEDALLDGGVRLMQPRGGFRAAIDPVILAASVAAKAGDTVLDVGVGTGAAALCLAHRLSGVRVTGIDVNVDFLALADGNARRNGLDDRVKFLAADVSAQPRAFAPPLVPDRFDHVMTNPPYLAAGCGRAPSDPVRAVATMEGTADLETWLRFCVRVLRPKGTVTVIHRGDRLDHVLACLAGRVGDIRILPLWPGKNRPASRVIVAGRKGSRAPMQLLPGLALHTPDGSFTAEAQGILRRGEQLTMWDRAT
ncbi:MAG: methyltransferase domain-containing protein [Rhodospirillales bacterium]|nr:methyltransferase domain-containing protein [Rhodospirillales bacterium]